MALTYKSTIPEQRTIVEQNKNGDRRVARAVQSDHNGRMWNLSLEHPSGMTWKGTFHGDGNPVNVALTQMLMDRENDYQDEIARGHKPPPAQRDQNVRVDELGNNISAPIYGEIIRRS